MPDNSKTPLMSVCIVSKNRSKIETDDGLTLNLLPECIKSLGKFLKRVNFSTEIIVADFCSTDWNPEEWMPDLVKNIPYKIIKVKGRFSRGKGRNIAFRHSSGSKIFFLDADMYFTKKDVLVKGMKHQGAYFPICYSYYNHQNNEGWWRFTGFGNLIVDRNMFYEVGEWKERYSWGGEDDQMYMSLSRRGSVMRDKVDGFFHRWHPYERIPEIKKSFWKKLFR